MLSWLFPKPYKLVTHHASVEDRGPEGLTLHLQAVIEARKPIGGAINIHVELQDDEGQVIGIPTPQGVIDGKKTVKNIHLHKGESTMVEWIQLVDTSMPRHLNMKVGVWNADYSQTLAWYSPRSWTWHPRW